VPLLQAALPIAAARDLASHDLRPSAVRATGARIVRLLTTIIVNNPTDTPVAGKVDLREAIDQANTTAGADTILFSGAVFTPHKTITLNGTQLELTDTTGATTIVGP